MAGALNPAAGAPAGAPGRPALAAARGAAAVIAAAVAAGATRGYQLWFRDSRWFAIDEVTVTGATTNEPRDRAALEQRRQDMTTLHVKDGELARRRRTLPDGGIRAREHKLPACAARHGDRAPAGRASSGSADSETAVSADGYLLAGASFDAKALPRIEGAPAQRRPARRRRGRAGGDPRRRAGAAAGPGRRRRPGTTQQGGVVVDLTDGPELRLRRRLAGSGQVGPPRSRCSPVPSTARPRTLDVGVPDRPVSGG